MRRLGWEAARQGAVRLLETELFLLGNVTRYRAVQQNNACPMAMELDLSKIFAIRSEKVAMQAHKPRSAMRLDRHDRQAVVAMLRHREAQWHLAAATVMSPRMCHHSNTNPSLQKISRLEAICPVWVLTHQLAETAASQDLMAMRRGTRTQAAAER